MEFFIFLILAVAVVAVLFLIAWFLPSENEMRGMRGEKTVFSILKKLPDEYYIWNDVVIQRNGYSVQIDHIAISPYGIFIIETKNMKGWIYGNDDCDKWTKTNWGYKYHFHNPVRQNHAHVKALANLFRMSENQFIPIVVFLDSAELYCNTNSTVIYASQLLDEINKYRVQVMSLSDVQQLAYILNSATVETKETRNKHLNMVYQRSNRKDLLVDNKICPRCGGKLVGRSGAYGYFLGCSNYPNCKFTTPL